MVALARRSLRNSTPAYARRRRSPPEPASTYATTARTRVRKVKLQSEYPNLEGVTYLNTASIGLVPSTVIGKAHYFEAEIARRGTAAMDEETEVAVFESARQAAASLLNAPIANIALTSSS